MVWEGGPRDLGARDPGTHLGVPRQLEDAEDPNEPDDAEDGERGGLVAALVALDEPLRRLLLLLGDDGGERDEVGHDGDEVDRVHHVLEEFYLGRTGGEANDQLQREPDDTCKKNHKKSPFLNF